MSDQNFQDWTIVTFRKKKNQDKPKTKKPESSRDGDNDDYIILKKTTGGTNSAASSKPKVEASRLRKIADTEIAPLPKITQGMKLAMSQGRTTKGLTQKELAQRLNVKQSIIQDYESGKAVPDGKFIAKIEKVLEVKINGQ